LIIQLEKSQTPSRRRNRRPQAGRLRSSLGRKAKGKKYICKFHPAPRSIERSVDFEWQISGATPVICGKTFTINPAAFSRPADG